MFTKIFHQWINREVSRLDPAITDIHCQAITGDASFRQYFRVVCDKKSFIAVSAPPELENSTTFIDIANHWLAKNINVPHILAYDLKQGFLLQSDFGDLQYLVALENSSDLNTLGNTLYSKAIDALISIQQIQDQPLPSYDHALLEREILLFNEWFLEKFLQLSLSTDDRNLLQKTYQQLIAMALEQPTVCVHRDYHSRNLMVTDTNPPGIIDFQDAVMGPITYDLVSLLRDCYISWPEQQIHQWIDHYYQQASTKNLLNCEPEAFMHWFDWMGIQRHLKAIGIFSRLNIRDNKSHYLNDIPRTLNYVLSVAKKYPELTDFSQWLNERVMPIFQIKQNTAQQHSMENSH